MASSLRLVTSNLVTRSFGPTVVYASRILSIDDGHRSYTTMPIDTGFYDQSRPRIVWPKSSLMVFHMWMTSKQRNLTLHATTGMEAETDKNLNVKLIMRGLGKEKLRACVKHKLPDKRSSDINKEMSDGMLKVTLPNEDEFKTYNSMANIIASDAISSFRKMHAKLTWDYYDIFFDRSFLAKRLCPVIAALSSINSFSIRKEEVIGKDFLDILVNMPGLEKMKLTTQGLRVSLEMRMDGLKRRDVKTFFDYDTLFIEAKTKSTHHITGIHLPEGIHMKHNMIKRKLIKNVLYAFIPCCVKKEELRDISDQLKKFSKRNAMCNKTWSASVMPRGTFEDHFYHRPSRVKRGTTWGWA